MLLGEQGGDHADLARGLLVSQGQGVDRGGVALPVAVDAPVALLEADKGPGDVVVHEQVALLVQVEALGGHVRGQEHPDRGTLLAEGLHSGLDGVVGLAGVEGADRVLGHVQAAGELARQHLNGVNAFGEDDDTGVAVLAHAELLQEGGERPGLGRSSHLGGQGVQTGQGAPLSGLGGAVGARQGAQAVGDGGAQGLRGGQEGLEQGPGEERAALAGHGGGPARGVEPHGVQLGHDLALGGAGGHRVDGRLEALTPAVGDLGAHLRAAAVAAHVEVGDVSRGVGAGVGDRRGVQQGDELGEGLRAAVVGRGRGQDEGVGVPRQDPGQLVVLGAAVDEVVALVDDDGVPAVGAQVVAVQVRVLQGVDGDDHPVEVGEGVASGGQVPLDALDAGGVQAHQGDAEAREHLVLELLEDRARRDHEDAVPAAAGNELGQGDADLQGLAQAHRVADQQARAQVGQHGPGRAQLVVQVVQEGAVTGDHAGVRHRDRAAAHDGVQPQARTQERPGGVRYQADLTRVEAPDLVDGGEEGGLVVPHELGGARDLQPHARGGR